MDSGIPSTVLRFEWLTMAETTLVVCDVCHCPLDPSHDDVLMRHVPVKKVKLAGGEAYVATVFDLLCANYGVDRGLGGEKKPTINDVARLAGVSKKTAKARAWATVNKQDGGGKTSGSARKG